MGHAVGRLESHWTRVGSLWVHSISGASPAAPATLPLVFVHGLLVSSRYMRAAAERLAASHPVYALDLPGYGHSSKPPAAWSGFDLPRLTATLCAWMDTLGLTRVAFIANSFGCQVVTAVARQEPTRADGLVLVGPTIDPRHHSVASVTARLLLDATREPPHRYLPLLAADLWDTGLPRTIRLARVALRDHIEERLPYITAPTLIVRGGRDPLVPRRWAQDAAALLPDGRLTVIPGYAHIVHYTAPDIFVQLIHLFLAALASPPEPPSPDTVREEAQRRRL